MAFTPTTNVVPFIGWTWDTPALPEFYWDVYSNEQRIKKLCWEFAKMVCFSNYLVDNINTDHELITQLQNAFNDFLDHGFDEHYKEQVKQWIDENFKAIMDGLVGHMLFFELTADGYFAAYIPPKWAFELDTDIDYDSINYGCLEIIY